MFLGPQDYRFFVTAGDEKEDAWYKKKSKARKEKTLYGAAVRFWFRESTLGDCIMYRGKITVKTDIIQSSVMFFVFVSGCCV